MKRTIVILFMFGLIFYLTGCIEKEETIVSSSNPKAKEILKLDPSADFFQWNGVIYKTNIDWVDELIETKGEKVGEITEVTPTPENVIYKNGMSNKLPVGTEIYSVAGRSDIVIAEYEGKLKMYLAIVEG
jgi:hypothetical protein